MLNISITPATQLTIQAHLHLPEGITIILILQLTLRFILHIIIMELLPLQVLVLDLVGLLEKDIQVTPTQVSPRTGRTMQLVVFLCTREEVLDPTG